MRFFIEIIILSCLLVACFCDHGLPIRINDQNYQFKIGKERK